MSLIDFTIQLTRTNDLLEDLCKSSRLTAEALIRLSPPLPDSSHPPYRAGVKDLIDVSPANVAARLQEMEDLGTRTNTIPGSEAFQRMLLEHYAMVKEYEELLVKENGEEIRQVLPWNKK